MEQTQLVALAQGLAEQLRQEQQRTKEAEQRAKEAELRGRNVLDVAKPIAGSDPITFVHVGKTGGSTLREYFREHNIEHEMVHVAPGDTYKWRSGMQMRGRCIIVSVRDPVARTISAFNWRHPVGGVRSTDMNSLPGGDVEEKLYECFPELPGGINKFAEALNESTKCGNIVRARPPSPLFPNHRRAPAAL